MGSFGKKAVGFAVNPIGEVTKNLFKAEKPPATPDAAAQKRQADAEVEAAQLKDINTKNSGLNSTILGGSTDTTDSNLKKKKLLGE